LPASTYVETDKGLTQKLSNFFTSKNINYITGTTWTMDAFYRETKNRIKKRISQGALCVEMECSALAAACKFYGLKFCQFLYLADVIKQNAWTNPGTKESRRTLKSKMLELALEFASLI
jgi:purine-nucleoside phosphorylase